MKCNEAKWHEEENEMVWKKWNDLKLATWMKWKKWMEWNGMNGMNGVAWNGMKWTEMKWKWNEWMNWKKFDATKWK